MGGLESRSDGACPKPECEKLHFPWCAPYGGRQAGPGPKLKLLGPNDEPQNPGAIVAVHWGDYRRQELWVRSGANIGNWYPLGGEFGRPKVWTDPRNELEKIADGIRGEPAPRPGPGEVPLHPHWEDVLARGPVVLLTAAAHDTYAAGWRNGRVDLYDKIEGLVHDGPVDQEGDSDD